MWLFKASGILGNFNEENQIDDETQALLVDAAEAFLSGGGHYSPGDWAMLSSPEQAAFVVANERVWAARIASIFRAMNAPLEAAKMIKPFDNGAEESKIGLAVAVAVAAKKYAGAVVQ